MADNPGKIFGILSIVFAGLSLLILPIIFGPLGIIMAVIALVKGEKKLGIIGLILSIVLSILGFVLGFVVAMMFMKDTFDPTFLPTGEVIRSLF